MIRRPPLPPWTSRPAPPPTAPSPAPSLAFSRTVAVTLVAAAVALAAVPVALAGCSPTAGLRAAVSMTIQRSRTTPADASVTIDEEYIGPLGYVAAHGVRLPVGQHRITVEKEGYFPWDKLVEADRKPIQLDVVLEPIPD